MGLLGLVLLNLNLLYLRQLLLDSGVEAYNQATKCQRYRQQNEELSDINEIRYSEKRDRRPKGII